MKKTREEKAITLIALIITIVVLLILAVVAINAVTGDGIIQHAVNAKTEYEKAQKEEGTMLDSYLTKLEVETLPVISIKEVVSEEKFLETRKIEDSSGNIVIIPKGFSILKEEADHVSEGIVIRDETGAETNGSEFVWIPVGNINKEDNTISNVELGRYIFDSNGDIAEIYTKPEDKVLTNGTNVGEYYTEGLKDSSTINAHAKDIEGFLNSVKQYGGYYIGRYEARTNSEISRASVTDELSSTTCKPENSIYNYVTQIQASELSQQMYESNNNTNVISDLINSFAWDTAIVFIQEMGNAGYSVQSSKNTGNLAERGTNNLIDVAQQDEVCNIWDMASNAYDASTETYSDSEKSCVARGGTWRNNIYYTKYRAYLGTSGTAANFSFRTILYL